MISQSISLKTIFKTWMSIIRIAVDNAVKLANHFPFAPFAFMLAQTIWTILRSGPLGVYHKVGEVLSQMINVAKGYIPVALRSKLEAFFVDVLLQLT